MKPLVSSPITAVRQLTTQMAPCKLECEQSGGDVREGRSRCGEGDAAVRRWLACHVIAQLGGECSSALCGAITACKRRSRQWRADAEGENTTNRRRATPLVCGNRDAGKRQRSHQTCHSTKERRLTHCASIPTVIFTSAQKKGRILGPATLSGSVYDTKKLENSVVCTVDKEIN